MTSPLELIDSFSETLLRDERILGLREKEILTNLLQRASTHDAAVNAAIAQTVGEIVAQRAYEVLGSSITRKLVAQATLGSQAISGNLGPAPPSPQPRPPGPGLAVTTHLGPAPNSPQPRPPGPGPGITSHLGPAPNSPQPRPPGPGPGVTTHLGPAPNSPQPRPPGPGPGITSHLGPAPNSPQPRPPGPGVFRQAESTAVAVMDEPVVRFANCVIFDEFLVPAEVSALLQFALEHESEFQMSEVVSPGVPGGTVDYEHRRSLVLMDLGSHRDVIVNRIQSCWPRILQKLGHDPFVASDVEVQITASNDGDFFRCHNDNGQPETAAREVTFVYFLHREPKNFRGGELRIFDSRWESDGYVRTDNYRAVVPQQNQLVLFVSSLEHEITPVECPAREFADSRFTVNGWFRR